ncbi:MAG: NrdH-redoxin [Candidatus Liptonbacteria bacterium]|nr:NrdH-redoxin [Candidatus Liptonbacteria bacterium]
MESSKKVEIYSTPSCQFCRAAKEFFKRHNVQYADYNVAEDEAKREEMVKRSGQLGVPVIFVGEEMVVGFDEPALKRLLAIS